ncbi:hypothetical protein XANCAGTX0491_002428 [Xanthoria calcicola]
MILGLVMPSSDESLLTSLTSSSDKNPVAPAVAVKVLPNKDKQSGSIKLKKFIARVEEPR